MRKPKPEGAPWEKCCTPLHNKRGAKQKEHKRQDQCGIGFASIGGGGGWWWTSAQQQRLEVKMRFAAVSRPSEFEQ